METYHRLLTIFASISVFKEKSCVTIFAHCALASRVAISRSRSDVMNICDVTATGGWILYTRYPLQSVTTTNYGMLCLGSVQQKIRPQQHGGPEEAEPVEEGHEHELPAPLDRGQHAGHLVLPGGERTGTVLLL